MEGTDTRDLTREPCASRHLSSSVRSLARRAGGHHSVWPSPSWPAECRRRRPTRRSPSPRPRRRSTQLETDAAAIDQEYVGVEEQLDQGQGQAQAQAGRRQGPDRAGRARLKFQVGQVALAQFQNRNLDTAAQLFVTPDTEGFLSQISTVEKVSENQNSALQDYQQQQAAPGRPRAVGRRPIWPRWPSRRSSSRRCGRRRRRRSPSPRPCWPSSAPTSSARIADEERRASARGPARTPSRTPSESEATSNNEQRRHPGGHHGQRPGRQGAGLRRGASWASPTGTPPPDPTRTTAPD